MRYLQQLTKGREGENTKSRKLEGGEGGVTDALL